MILIVGPRSTFGFVMDLYVFFYVIARFFNDFVSFWGAPFGFLLGFICFINGLHGF